MKVLFQSLNLFRPCLRRGWLISSLTLGITTSSIQIIYHIDDFRENFAFASDVPFNISISKKSVDFSQNGAISSELGNLPYQGVLEGKNLNWQKDKITIKFQKSPRELKVLSFRRVSPDPYQLTFFCYYNYLSSNIKDFLGFFNEPPFLTTFHETRRFSLQDQENPIPNILELDPAKFELLDEGNYHILSFWKTFLRYSLIHFLLFSFAVLPFFHLNRVKIQKLGTFLKNRLLIIILALFLPIWGFYSYELSREAGILSTEFFTGWITWISFTFFGFLLYATLISILWSQISKISLLLKMIAFLFILSLYAIILIQAGFLAFTANHISLVYFTMLTTENFRLFFDLLPTLLVPFLLLIFFYLIVSSKSLPQFPWFLTSFLPLFLLISYSFSFGVSLDLKKKGFPIFSPSQAVSRLAFSPFLNPLLEFNRELIRYLKLVFIPNQHDINLQPFHKKDMEIGKNYGLNLGEESSHFPAGKQPFKRVILLMIEGYRLAYIPEFNPAIQGLVAPFPFFSRPEVQKGRKENYYSSTAFTTRSLRVAMMSHLNSQKTSFNVNNLAKYPSLPRLLKNAGFRTLFIRTASRGFDNFNQIFTALGMDRIFEMQDLEFVGQKDYTEAGLSEPIAWAYPSRLLFKEVLGQLKKAQEEEIPIFTLVINIDTHNPPLGMAMNSPSNYGTLVYPNPLIGHLNLTKAVTNTLIATYRFAYDLDLFYQNLQEWKLWDQETLLVISADHSQGGVDETLFPSDRQQKLFEELPFIVLSGRKLPDFNQSFYASHLDLAPTILDLVGINKPAGYWGKSLYSPITEKRKAWFNYKEGYIYTKEPKLEKEWILELNPDLKELYSKFLVDFPY